MFAKVVTNFINILFKRRYESTDAYAQTTYPYKNTLTMAPVYLYILDRCMAQKHWSDANYLREFYGTESFADYWLQRKVNITNHGNAYLEVLERDEYLEFLESLYKEGWQFSTPMPDGIRLYTKLIFEKHDVTPHYG